MLKVCVTATAVHSIIMDGVLLWAHKPVSLTVTFFFATSHLRKMCGRATCFADEPALHVLVAREHGSDLMAKPQVSAQGHITQFCELIN